MLQIDETLNRWVRFVNILLKLFVSVEIIYALKKAFSEERPFLLKFPFSIINYPQRPIHLRFNMQAVLRSITGTVLYRFPADPPYFKRGSVREYKKTVYKRDLDVMPGTFISKSIATYAQSSNFREM